MSVPVMVQSAQAVVSGTQTSLTATYGSTPTQGNLLIAVFKYDSDVVPALSGWTARRYPGNGAQSRKIAVWTKVAGASESTSVVFTFSSSTRAASFVCEISGASTESPEIWEETGGSSATQTVPSVTPLAGQDVMLVAIAGVENAQGINTAPSGYTLIQDAAAAPGGASYRISGHYKTVSSPSGSYSSSIVYAGSVTGVVLHVAIGAPETATAIGIVQSAGIGTTSNVTTLTATLGATPTNGNYLVGIYASEDSNAPSFPGGWTSQYTTQATGGVTNMYITVYTKAAASDPAGTVITFSINQVAVLAVVEVAGSFVAKNIGTVNPLGPQVYNTSPSITPNGVQTGLLEIIAYHNAQSIVGFPPGYNSVLDVNSNAGGSNTIKVVTAIKVIRSPSGAYTTKFSAASDLVSAAQVLMSFEDLPPSPPSDVILLGGL